MARRVTGWERETPVPNHIFNSFLSSREGRLFFEDLDLAGLFLDEGSGGSPVEALPSPLELVYLPKIRDRIDNLCQIFAAAIAERGYQGRFHYAYASKANMAEEVVRTTLAAGAHYEMSSVFDVDIVRLMSHRGQLPPDRIVLANGFKGPGSGYARNLVELKSTHANLIPVIEDRSELVSFLASDQSFDVGLRQKSYGLHADEAAMDATNSRFGLQLSDVWQAANEIAAAPNLTLRLYHAMVGSQLTDELGFVEGLRPAMTSFARLRQCHAQLSIFDFGGGLPAAMTLDFDFDFEAFATQLLATMQRVCDKASVPVPDIMGELGRYTTAEHGAHLFKVLTVKDNGSDLPWYIIDGSIMTSFPDSWALGEHFTVLPLNHLDKPFRQVQLGGITCDSDDIYPPKSSRSPLFLPEATEDLHVGFFSVGAYQEMLGGVRGSKHCALPEAAELLVDRSSDGELVFELLPGHTSEDVLKNLGYMTDDIAGPRAISTPSSLLD